MDDFATLTFVPVLFSDRLEEVMTETEICPNRLDTYMHQKW